MLITGLAIVVISAAMVATGLVGFYTAFAGLAVTGCAGGIFTFGVFKVALAINKVEDKTKSKQGIEEGNRFNIDEQL